jgi:hypothetical protein
MRRQGLVQPVQRAAGPPHEYGGAHVTITRQSCPARSARGRKADRPDCAVLRWRDGSSNRGRPSASSAARVRAPLRAHPPLRSWSSGPRPQRAGICPTLASIARQHGLFIRHHTRRYLVAGALWTPYHQPDLDGSKHDSRNRLSRTLSRRPFRSCRHCCRLRRRRNHLNPVNLRRLSSTVLGKRETHLPVTYRGRKSLSNGTIPPSCLAVNIKACQHLASIQRYIKHTLPGSIYSTIGFRKMESDRIGSVGYRITPRTHPIMLCLVDCLIRRSGCTVVRIRNSDRSPVGRTSSRKPSIRKPTVSLAICISTGCACIDPYRTHYRSLCRRRTRFQG